MSGFRISMEDNGDNGQCTPAPGRLFLTAPDEDGNQRLVEESHPDARILFSPHEGYPVDKATLDKLLSSSESAPEAPAVVDDGDDVETPEEPAQEAEEADDEVHEDFGAKKQAPRGRKR